MILTPQRLILLAIIIAALIIIGITYIRYTTKPHKKLYILKIKVEGNGQVLNHTPLSYYEKDKKVVLEARPNEGYYLAEWRLDYKVLGNDTTIEVTLDANHTIVAVFRPKPKYRVIVVYVLGNETVVAFNDIIKEGELFKWEFPEVYGNYTFKYYVYGGDEFNYTTFKTRVSSPVEIKAFYEPHQTTSIIMGNILVIESNIVGFNYTLTINNTFYNATFSGEASYELENVSEISFEADWRVPLNDTYCYWLAWYWINTTNSSVWWSYGLNGSRLEVAVNDTVRIGVHYVLGLAEMPYVINVMIFPKEYEDVYQTTVLEWDEELGVIYRVIDFHPPIEGTYPSFELLMEFPDVYGLVKLRVEFPEPFDDYDYVDGRKVYCACTDTALVLLEGQEYCGLASLPVDSRGTVWEIYYYWDCYKLVQDKLREYREKGIDALTFFLKYRKDYEREIEEPFKECMMSKPILHVIDGKPVYYKGVGHSTWVFGFGEMQYPDFKEPVRFPNTGRQALVIDGLHSEKLIVARVLIEGVAP